MKLKKNVYFALFFFVWTVDLIYRTQITTCRCKVAIVGSKFQEVYQAMEIESQDYQLELQNCSSVFDDAHAEQPLESHESLAELVKDIDLTNVHPMMQRQVQQLIPLVDNASQLQKRLSSLHAQEDKMHEALQEEFETFIEKMKQRSIENSNQDGN